MRILLVCLFAVNTACAIAPKQTSLENSIYVELNKDFIERVNTNSIDLDDYKQVLKSVLSSAGDPIKVYPSEGYFYFSFYSGGDLVRGNLRFDKYLREDGLVSFAYFRQYAGTKRRDIDRDKHWTLGPKHGFVLTQTDPFHFAIEYEGISASVEIYDAKRELAAKKTIRDGEIYVGPVFDESGVRFHLIFDKVTNVFLFVLNDSLGTSETNRRHPENANILIGHRTQFAYYLDAVRNRQVLIGVNRANVRANTYYDGPFDQLPDSFIDPDKFKDLILRYKPTLAGKIGPGGIFLSNENMRVGLYPYMEYASERQLLSVSRCEKSIEELHVFNRCLADLKTGSP